MKNSMVAILAMAFATFAHGQSPSFAEVCESQVIPTRAEYESNPVAYADNFCALATYAPHRAARQFNSMISLVRGHNNPNRFYWDPRLEPNAPYIQLLQPWMVEQDYLIKWDQIGGYERRVNNDIAFFHGDQRRLGTDRRYAIWLRFWLHDNDNDNGFTYYGARFFLWREGEAQSYLLRGDQVDGTNQVRFRLDADRGVSMTSSLLTAGIHHVLGEDCLGSVVFQPGDDCETTMTFGSASGSTPELLLEIGEIAEYGVQPSTTTAE